MINCLAGWAGDICVGTVTGPRAEPDGGRERGVRSEECCLTGIQLGPATGAGQPGSPLPDTAPICQIITLRHWDTETVQCTPQTLKHTLQHSKDIGAPKYRIRIEYEIYLHLWMVILHISLAQNLTSEFSIVKYLDRSSQFYLMWGVTKCLTLRHIHGSQGLRGT